MGRSIGTYHSTPPLLLLLLLPLYSTFFSYVGDLFAGVRSGWDYFEEDGCYVNGHYTDSSCTLGMSSLPLIIRAAMVLMCDSQTRPLLVGSACRCGYQPRGNAGSYTFKH